MKFALLGLDDDTRLLCRSILDSDAHELVAICHEGDLEAADPDWKAGQVESVSLAELATRADVVIVSRSQQMEARFEQAKFLARQAIDLVVSQPISASALDCYELEMIVGDTGRSLVPLLVDHATASLRYVCDAVRKSNAENEQTDELGEIEQIVMHRRLPNRERRVVMEQFARDAVLLSQLCGELKSVAAMGPDVTADKFANLNVQIAAQNGRLAHWSVEPADAEASARLQIIGSRKTLTLELFSCERRDEWSLCVGDAPVAGVAEEEVFDLVGEVVGQLSGDAEAGASLPTWRDATRGVELAETAMNGLRKGRTIKLRAEGRGEEEAFKGTMAATGCAILIGATVLLFVLAVVAFVARSSKIEWLQSVAGWIAYWPHALLSVLLAFLLTQFLRFIIPANSSEDGSPSSNADDA